VRRDVRGLVAASWCQFLTRAAARARQAQKIDLQLWYPFITQRIAGPMQ
jgi:hypothetical protein